MSKVDRVYQCWPLLMSVSRVDRVDKVCYCSVRVDKVCVC